MPDFDGSIIIGTEIDVTGIQRDMRKVEQAVHGAQPEVESISDSFRSVEQDAGRAATEIQRDTRRVERSAREAADEVDDIGDSFQDARRDAGRATRGIEDALDDLKSSINDVGDAVSAGFGIDMLLDFGSELMSTTDELRGDLSMLDQNARTAGAGIDATRQAFENLNAVSGETDSSVEAVSNLLQAGFTESNLQIAVEGLANAAITFPDTVRIESLADSLQETLATGQATGQFAELLDRVGYGAENFSNRLAMCTTEAQRQDLALDALTQGPLRGVYDSWAAANPELVRGRDATLELQEATADLAEELSPVMTDIEELAAGVVDFVAGVDGIDDIFTAIIGGVAALGAVKAIETISRIAQEIRALATAMDLTKISTGAAYAAFAVLFTLLLQAAGVWDSMSDVEKLTTILGAVTVAAFAAALAVGAFQSALSLGVAVVAITAGITAMTLAINQARSRAESMEAQAQVNAQMGLRTGTGATPYLASGAPIPALATGAVIPPNSEFLAVLGDQRNGRNLEAPEGLLRQIVREEGGAWNGTLTVRPAPGLTRYLSYELEVERSRAGTSVIGGMRR